MYAVTYPRVSSSEQAESGFSIPAQQKIFESYCNENGLSVIKEFVEVQSAKNTKRKQFRDMVEFVQNNNIKHIVIEKVDRMTRNLKDLSLMYDLVEEFNINLHLVKDRLVINRHSKSQEKLQMDIQAVLAKNRNELLAEEVRKGLAEKVSQGGYPRKAPIGYINNKNNGKIEIDPETADFIRQIFEWYVTGQYSIPLLRKKAKETGYLSGFNKYKASRNTLYKILTNPTYCGHIPFKEKLYPGNHEPIVSQAMFDQVQLILQGKSRPTRKNKHSYSYTGLFVCSKCGHAVTAERKKKIHVYYRCTHARFGCNNTKSHLKEETIEDQVTTFLQSINPNDNQVEWIQKALCLYHYSEIKKSSKMTATLKSRLESIHTKIEQAIEERANGVLSDSIWRSLSQKWQTEQKEVEEALEKQEKKTQPYYQSTDGVKRLLMKLPLLFGKQSDVDKQQFLKYLIEKSPLTEQIIKFQLKPSLLGVLT
jgi:site-specific DNA recombinase